MTEKKDRRGGRRPGAGRPKGDGRTVSFRCPHGMAEKLKKVGDRAGFIRACIDSGLDGVGNLSRPGTFSRATRQKPLHLPYFDVRVAAGFPVPLDNDERAQDVELLSLLCPHPEASYLIRVRGDSMVDAGLEDGDMVIIDRSNRSPSPDEIAMCEIDGEYTLKHVVRDGGTAWLVPANPKYRRREITADDAFSVWGTVTYIIHRARG